MLAVFKAERPLLTMVLASRDATPWLVKTPNSSSAVGTVAQTIHIYTPGITTYNLVIPVLPIPRTDTLGTCRLGGPNVLRCTPTVLPPHSMESVVRGRRSIAERRE